MPIWPKPSFAEWYSYNAAGGVTAKRLQLKQQANWKNSQGYRQSADPTLNFDAKYTFDSGGEGHN